MKTCHNIRIGPGPKVWSGGPFLETKVARTVWNLLCCRVVPRPHLGRTTFFPFPTEFYKGKRVILTGASMGIGKSIAVQLAQLGAK